MKENLGMNFLAPLEFRLTGKEGQMLGRLLKGGAVTKTQFMTSLYSGMDEPELKIIDVFICKLRKKLKPWGLEIQTIWGSGYFMPEASIAKFREFWPK